MDEDEVLRRMLAQARLQVLAGFSRHGVLCMGVRGYALTKFQAQCLFIMSAMALRLYEDAIDAHEGGIK